MIFAFANPHLSIDAVNLIASIEEANFDRVKPDRFGFGSCKCKLCKCAWRGDLTDATDWRSNSIRTGNKTVNCNLQFVIHNLWIRDSSSTEFESQSSRLNDKWPSWMASFVVLMSRAFINKQLHSPTNYTQNSKEADEEKNWAEV